MNKRRFLFTIFFFLAVPVFVAAQIADEIENLLRTEAVSCEQAARFVLDAADVSGSFNRSSPEEAFRFAAQKRWLPEKASPAKKISLRDVSFLIMQAFGIKGRAMYALFKTPHFAYREMIYQDIIQDRADPGINVSGSMLLFLVNRILYRIDDSPWEFPEEPEPVKVADNNKREPEDHKTDTATSNPIIADFSGNLAQKLLWLSSNAEDGETYTIEINADERISPQYLYYDGKTVSITLKGNNAVQSVSLNANGSMFMIGPGVTLILDNNVAIIGRSDNTDSLIKVSGGNLVINNGAKVTGNATYYGGGVYVGWERTFTMSGGEISGNTAYNGGGAYVSSDGTLTKTGGTISGNTAYNGGGVYVSNGTFTMSEGRISGNTASCGGGVYVSNGKFSKTSGTIYGYNARDNNSNVVKSSSGAVLSGNGHAVYASNWSGDVIKLKETTAGPNVNLSFDKNNSTWSGGWDK